MKKAIALLLALALVGGAVFAQELKFSGYLDTGIAIIDDGLDIGETGDADTADGAYLGLWGDDSGTLTRFNLQAAVTNENVGATARLRFQGDVGAAEPAVWVNRAFVWATMLDGKVKTVAGKLGDYTWASFGNDIGAFDAKTGFQVQVMPMDGLNFGFILPASSSAQPLVEDAMKDIILGASYTMDGIGSFRAGYDMSPADDSAMAYFSAKITAVENLVVIVDAQLKDMGNDATGETYLFQEFDYTMDALNVGIDLEQTLYADDAKEMKLMFGPYVEYDMGTFLPGFVFEYTMQDDLSGMYLNPYVKYKVGPGAVIELGGKINSGDFSEASRYYLAYTWSF